MEYLSPSIHNAFFFSSNSNKGSAISALLSRYLIDFTDLPFYNLQCNLFQLFTISPLYFLLNNLNLS